MVDMRWIRIAAVGLVLGTVLPAGAARAQVVEAIPFVVPPEPASGAAPGVHATWKRSLAATRNQTVSVLQPTDISNGPVRLSGKPAVLSDKAVGAASGNWSGTSVVNGTISKKQAIVAEFIVPTARQAAGVCTGGWDYSSLWPGIDGNGSDDVLQGGVEVDAYCKAGTTASLYSAWVEWYPYNETRVSQPAMHPGDLVYVQVWSESPTKGYVYFYNDSTQQSAEYVLTAPSGTALQGSSVEWIVERPSVGNSLATLTNYIGSAWPVGFAWNYSSTKPRYYDQGGNPSYGTIEFITMLDDNGVGISSATAENAGFLWFTDSGSAN